MKTLILLADSDPSVRTSLARVLESEDYEVGQAENGRALVRLASMQPPPLVIMDLNLPDLNGWQLFDWLKQQWPALPVIILSSRSNTCQRTLQTGLDTLMEKPLDVRFLLQTIQRCLVGSSPSGSLSFAKTNCLPEVAAKNQ